MLAGLTRIDRRWLFLAMFLAVALPVLLRFYPPEKPTMLVRNAFDAIEQLPEGSRVFFAMDYDPASQPELGPMATAMVRHCALRGHKMYFLTLWPAGPPMIEDSTRLIEREFGDRYQYGEDYIELGFKAGVEAVIRQSVADLRSTFPVDHRHGRSLAAFPMMEGVRSLRDSDLLVSIGAGYPGSKEWVQYAAIVYPADIRLLVGATGVSAPPLYPYIPDQIEGMLPALKGAAEYEVLLAEHYEQYAEPEHHRALARMGPQLVAHVLMIVLIVTGNVIYFFQRRGGRVR